MFAVKLVASVAIGVLLVPLDAQGQFYGSASLGTTYSSNAQGLDSAVADLLLEPSIYLGYEYLRDQLTIDATAGLTPSRYVNETERSYSTLFLSVTPTYRIGTATTSTGTAEALTATIAILEQVNATRKDLAAVRSAVRGAERASLDSAIELLSVIEELLKETSFTSSVKEVVSSELRAQRAGLSRLPSKHRTNVLRSWDALTSLVAKTDAEDDLGEIESSGESRSSVAKSLGAASMLALSPTSTRFRYLSSIDFHQRNDASYASSRWLSTLISVPLNLSIQQNQETYERYSNRAYSGGLRLGALLGEALHTLIGLDLLRTTYPNDTVYTNRETRVRAQAKYVLSEKLIGALEVAAGFRNYLSPLQVTYLTRPPRPQYRTLRASSEFSQFGTGLWLHYLLGEESAVGAVVSLTRSPDLKAYVTTNQDYGILGNAVGIANDEYNYDLSRFMGFYSTSIGSVDIGVDLTYEHRKYGEVDEAFANISDETIQTLAGAKRIEGGYQAAVSMSRYYPFSSPVLSVFSALSVDATLLYSVVRSTIEDFEYDNASASVTISLSF